MWDFDYESVVSVINKSIVESVVKCSEVDRCSSCGGNGFEGNFD